MVSHLNSSTRRSHQCPLKKLCFLVILVLLQRTHPSVKLLICLELEKLRILHAALAAIRPRTLLISSCAVMLRTLRRSLFCDLFSATSWSKPWKVVRPLRILIFRHDPIARKSRATRLDLKNLISNPLKNFFEPASQFSTSPQAGNSLIKLLGAA